MKKSASIVLLCWLAMAGADFLLHGGLLAGYYMQETPFLRPMAEAFRLIPLGYAGLFLLAILLTWVVVNLNPVSTISAARTGLLLGLLVSGGTLLGVISISTIGSSLALAWSLSQTIQFIIGAVVVAEASKASSLRRITAKVVIFVVLSFLVTIALQSLGLVPTIRIQ